MPSYQHAIALPPKAPPAQDDVAGLLFIDKPVGVTAFFLVSYLRRLLGVRTIGHAGTLDPFATGVMILLVGKKFTRLSDSFLATEKAYVARLQLGSTTDTYDSEGEVVEISDIVPTLIEVEEVVERFQGECLQVPPMFSAKKQQGKKLYELARAGKTVERQPVKVHLATELLEYTYPFVDFKVSCSKGTYIRSVGHDMGQQLGCGGHLVSLRRVRSGSIDISMCVPLAELTAETVHTYLAKHTEQYTP